MILLIFSIQKGLKNACIKTEKVLRTYESIPIMQEGNINSLTFSMSKQGF